MRMNTLLKGLQFIAFCTLIGCASQPEFLSELDETISLKGKIIVSAEQEKRALNFRWLKGVDRHLIDLWGPLGSHRTRLRFDEHDFEIDLPDGQVLDESDAKLWLYQTFGTNTKPTSLVSWMTLQPIQRNRIKQASYDKSGRLMSFYELGWFIESLDSEPRAADKLPSRIRLSNEHVSVEILIRQ